MIFSKDITIPANTTKESPLRVRIPISEGVVRHVWIRWRWGSANLCGARILYQEFQIWPLSLTQWFISQLDSLDFDEEFSVDGIPHEFVAELYNLDDTYPHNVWVGFSVLREGGWSLPVGREIVMEVF